MIQSPPVRMARRIIHAVLIVCFVDQPTFRSANRHPRVVRARELCSVLLTEWTTLSLPEMARFMGRPSHSTVVTARARFNRRIEAGDDEAIEQVEAVRRLVFKNKAADQAA